MGKYDYILAGSVTGIIGLGAFFVGLDLGLMSSPRSVRVFESEGRPNIMRVYNFGFDKLFVQSSEEPNNYNINLHEYLEGINDKHDRAIEKAQIEKLVDW